jgi:hypothetical protein
MLEESSRKEMCLHEAVGNGKLEYRGGDAKRMPKARELLQKAIRSPASLRFGEMVCLVKAFGFREARQQGSHHIFIRPDVKELLNVQDVHGVAKPYQVRQFLKLVERYNLRPGGRP